MLVVKEHTLAAKELPGAEVYRWYEVECVQLSWLLGGCGARAHKACEALALVAGQVVGPAQGRWCVTRITQARAGGRRGFERRLSSSASFSLHQQQPPPLANNNSTTSTITAPVRSLVSFLHPPVEYVMRA